MRIYDATPRPVTAQEIPCAAGLSAIDAENERVDFFAVADLVDAHLRPTGQAVGPVVVRQATCLNVPQQHEYEPVQADLQALKPIVIKALSKKSAATAEALADYRTSLREAPKGWHYQLDQRLQKEPVPAVFVHGIAVASRQAGRPLVWSEWLTGELFYGNVTDTQPFAAISDEQLLNLLQWNAHRAEELNADTKIQQRIQEALATTYAGLERAVAEKRLSSTLLARARQITPKIRVMDPLNSVQHDSEAAYFKSSGTILIEPDFKNSTFGHEYAHSLGSFKRRHRTEGYTDLVTMEILPEYRQQIAAGSYAGEIRLAEREMQAGDLSLQRVSAFMVGHNGELNEATLDAAMIMKHGRPLAKEISAVYDFHHEQAKARGENQHAARRSALQAAETWLEGEMVAMAKRGSKR